jgi:hypothetical protein
LFIDVESFFPVRADVVVESSGMCAQGGGVGLDVAGTREQWHFARIQRKDPCEATPKEVWVMDQAVSYGRIRNLDYRFAWGQKVAERRFQLDGIYMNGIFKNNAVNSDFRLFVTGACIRFGDEVEAQQVESVHSRILFDLTDTPFREPWAQR